MEATIKKLFILLIGLLLSVMFLVSCNIQHKTEVLVIGTLHHNHRNNANYSYENIVQAIATYNPDVICVEIRPEEFRKEKYLTEMMIGTVYGIDHNKKVYPIDWWKENTRALQRELRKKPEYIKKQKLADSLEAKNEIIQNFNNKYGNLRKNIRKFDYLFWNGDDFNNYISESYKISIQVFGDSPINLNYLTRNEKMLNYINKAIVENKGKKILVLTGVEHKHYFDNALSKRKDISLIRFDDILPLKKVQMDKDIVELIETGNSKKYYDIETQAGLDGYYSSSISILLHGPNMDFNPEIIPEENIKKAKLILDEWKQADPKSIILQFELGWYNFLTLSFSKAIMNYSIVIKNMNDITNNSDFIKAIVYRNIGWSYDMIGDRENAIESYKTGEILIEKTKFSRMERMIYKDYKIKPYMKIKKQN